MIAAAKPCRNFIVKCEVWNLDILLDPMYNTFFYRRQTNDLEARIRFRPGYSIHIHGEHLDIFILTYIFLQVYCVVLSIFLHSVALHSDCVCDWSMLYMR